MCRTKPASTTPAHIRPEWYFLGVYQYLKLMPSEVLGISGKALGIFTRMIVVILLFLVPFWYPLRSADVDRKNWPLGLLTFVFQWVAFLAPAAGFLWLRVTLMTGFATEGLILFLSLTIWAMWPAEGLFAEQGAHGETRRFLFAVGLMVFALTVLGAFLINELRVVHRTLDPEERDRLE